jgi:membrane protein
VPLSGLLARLEGTLVLDYLERLRHLQVVDRAMTIAAQLFVALLPLVLLAAGALSGADGEAVAEELIRRLRLEGGAVAAVRALFDMPDDVQRNVNTLGVLVVAFSAVTLSRRLGRLYESSWDLPPMGARALWRAVVWVPVATTYLVVTTQIRQWLAGHGAWTVVGVLVVMAGGGFLLWWWTQHFFLSARVRWSTLVPGALAHAFATVAVALYGAVYVPRTLASQAAQFGPIGVAFAIFSWLFAFAVAVVLAAVFGGTWAARRGWTPADASAPSGLGNLGAREEHPEAVPGEP